MRRYLYSMLIVAVCFTACDAEDDELDLDEQFEALVALSESVTCVDPAEWRVAGIGAKACGGPSDYIAYSVAIDTLDFLQRLETYNEGVAARIADSGLFSDCSITPPPRAVSCENGKAVLMY
ncbi:hypothetical protein ABV409_06595 [Flagellimonas sp. DF-77]|uniref:hypothetical protein n=1 Tax=Flagellimonas algarum TaxID=3230298 RepID=UPI0033982C79